MLWTDTSEGDFLANNGGVMLAEQTTFPSLKRVVESQGYLPVSVPAPGPAQRSNLSLLIEEAIEVRLETLGAVSPGVGASVDIDASISDQLYRARLLERRGIVLFLPNLEGMANLERTLDGEDSVALSWWMQATRERPVGLVIDASNRQLRVYPAPVAFDSLLRASTFPPPIPATAPEQASSSETMDLSAPPLPVSFGARPEPETTPELEASPELEKSPASSASEPCEVSSEPGQTDSHSEPIHGTTAGTLARDAVNEAPSVLADEPQHAVESASTAEPFNASPDIEHRTSSLTIQLVSDAVAANDDSHADSFQKSEPAADATEPQPGDDSADSLAAAGQATEAAEAAPAAEHDLPISAHRMLEVNAEPLDLGANTSVAPTAEAPVAEAPVADVHDALTLKAEPPPEVLEAVRQVQAATSAAPDAEPDTSIRAQQNEAEPDTVKPDTVKPSAGSAPRVDIAANGSDAGDGAATASLPPTNRGRNGRGAREGDDAEASDPFHRHAQREWPNWMRELNSTRGPKPLAVVERMFVAAYTPLREAYIRNIAGPEAKTALKTFRESFSHSYSEAFDALRVRGKRPTMVLDTPEIAQRIGRLHGARSTQLVLVDGMRFDIGLRIQDRLRTLARGEASLAERLLLWSALPTTTDTQLSLIGKGPSGLREPMQNSEAPTVVARGKNSNTLRRIKAGHKELTKLDTIEARLAEPGKSEAARLDEIADEVATAMQDHFAKLPPRTLVMMFGDHGFVLDPLDGGTSRGRAGGASPEEVLVPAFAWLVGSVH